MKFVSDTAATRHIEGKSAVYAFRDFGGRALNPAAGTAYAVPGDHGPLGSSIPRSSGCRETSHPVR